MLERPVEARRASKSTCFCVGAFACTNPPPSRPQPQIGLFYARSEEEWFRRHGAAAMSRGAAGGVAMPAIDEAALRDFCARIIGMGALSAARALARVRGGTVIDGVKYGQGAHAVVLPTLVK